MKTKKVIEQEQIIEELYNKYPDKEYSTHLVCEAMDIWAERQINKLNISAVINCVPYQICPKCAGDGDLFRFHSPVLMGTTAKPICDVCDGKKIIPMAHC